VVVPGTIRVSHTSQTLASGKRRWPFRGIVLANLTMKIARTSHNETSGDPMEMMVTLISGHPALAIAEKIERKPAGARQ
jgi:hypothetical protein